MEEASRRQSELGLGLGLRLGTTLAETQPRVDQLPPARARPSSVIISKVVQPKTRNAEAFDVRVLEFVGASLQTVHGLQQIFGIDAATAQRVIAGVPGVIRKRVPAAEAERVAQALARLGARVMLEAAAPLAPEGPGLPLPVPRQPPPPPAAAILHRPEADLPQPKMRVDAADLEYDVLSALEAAFDTAAPPPPSAAMPLPAPRPLPVPMPVPVANPDRQLASPVPAQTQRRLGHAELDLSEGRHDAKLDIDLEHGRTGHATTATLAAHPALTASMPDQLRKRTRSADTHMAVNPGARTNADAPGKHKLGAEQPPMSRAAVVERPVVEAPRSRTVPLLQLLAAMCVAVCGYWFDSSIAFGNASPISVIAHGLALQQLCLGVRGMFK